MKHLWLKPHPLWALWRPACFEAWGKPEAHQGCTADTCPWIDAQTRPMPSDAGFVLSHAELTAIRNAPVTSIPLVPMWSDPPAVIPLDRGSPADGWAGLDVDQGYRWHTSLMAPADVLRAGVVALCGRPGPLDETNTAALQIVATCVDCLHKVEIDRELSLCPVVPPDHAHLACRVPPSSSVSQRSVGTECRRCSGARPVPS